jgi:elongation factor Ts
MITASDVNKLRQMTGAGMMDCKKALTESNGDFEAAVDYLRKKGQKVASNRADREAKEGVVLAKITSDGKHGAIICLNCETDFVAKNDDFVKLTTSLLDLAVEKNPTSLEAFMALPMGNGTVSDIITDNIGRIGEKLELSRYETVDADTVVAYIHPGNRLATLVGVNKPATDAIHSASRDVAMQVAAMAPVALDKDDVDTEILNRELEIAKEQIRAEGKPEEMVEKIALGKLNKFYKESTLLNQEFIKDNKFNVSQYLDTVEKGLTVKAFKRVALS